MNKIVFFNLPGASGHINPTVGVVKELINSGVEVIYYAGEDSREKFEKIGATFRNYETWFDYSHNAEVGTDILTMAFAEIDLTLACIEPLLEITRQDQPDCIIYDPCCVWGKYIGEALKLPTVSSITTLVSTPWLLLCDWRLSLTIVASLLKGIPKITWARKIGIELMAKIGAEFRGIFYHIFDFFACVGELNIVFNSKSYQPFHNKLDGDFRFVGPSIPENRDAVNMDFSFIKGKQVIYVSLGTLHNQDINFYKNIITAFKEQEDSHVIMSVGKQTDITELGPIPTNFTVENFVPQLDVLKKTDLFITHGGMNSLNEAMYFGVPVIILPQQVEQAFNGRRLKKMGVAKILNSKKTTPEIIKQTAQEVLSNPSYKTSAEDYSVELRDGGGYVAAADAILRYVYGTEYSKTLQQTQNTPTPEAVY
ncbi:MAG: hypothetical protein COB04_04155 [Gammaproteobacteria bacterium]|nr:MAG: hypothetical protein COB04_04155 [Gammaproteobacteria bacterium]